MLITILPVNAFAEEIENSKIPTLNESNEDFTENTDNNLQTFSYDLEGNLILLENTNSNTNNNIDINNKDNADSNINNNDDNNVNGNNIVDSNNVENSCLCNTTNNIHSIDCPLYEEDNIQYACECTENIHTLECPLYEDKEECICGENVELHLENCPFFEKTNEKIDEKFKNILSFETLILIESLTELYNAVFENKNIVKNFSKNEKLELINKVEELYLLLSEPNEIDLQMKNELLDLLNDCIVKICESCGEEKNHLENCEFYICKECGFKEHSEECSKYIEIKTPSENVCSECNGINDNHLEDCSQYISKKEDPKPEFSPAPSITCSECNGENGEHIYGCSQYRCHECGFDEHLEECSLFICEECGEHSHLEGCIYYICEECGENEHLESCSLYKCLECGEKEHTKNCSKYVDTRPIFVRLLDTDLEGVYELLTNNVDSVNELTTEQIEEVIYYVGLIANNEDLEMEVLTILYTLPNAPTPPWKTLEDGIIYFDLAAGNITLNASTYSGYIFVNGVATAVTGEHLDNNEYYVYQSNGSSVEYADNGVPLYDRVRYNGNYWSNYIINNTNITSVVSNWTNAAKEVGRSATANYITVTGAGTYNVTIDNIWSTYNPSNTSRTTGGIGYSNTAGGVLTLYLKGDNRVGNIHYNGTTSKGKIIFENGGSENLPGSITCASYDGKSNHYNSVIGGNDNSGDSAYGITINGGIIYAGSQRGDNCTAIGAGGNGYGKIYINGGIVTAVANSSGAAIGGGIGESSTGGNALIGITDGEVYAYNFGYVSNMSGSKYFIAGAGIGGGSSCKAAGNSTTNITISGGYVYAQSLGGAAIGGGSSTMQAGGHATVTISGNAVVEAQSISGIDTNGQPVSAGTAIGGGTAGAAGTSNGGSITLNINGGTIYTGSIGGGGCMNTTGKIGSGTVNITNGIIRGQIVMGKGAGTNSFIMTGGRIDNERTPLSDSPYPFEFLKTNGGAVYLESGTANISGGRIINSNAINGGAIYVTGGNFEMHGGTIKDCYADKGGSVYVNSGNFDMDSGVIQDSLADNGGAIYVTGGNITMSGGTIYNCKATVDGGAIYVKGGNINIYDGILDGNIAENNGGAIYATSNSNDILINVLDGQITNNKSGNHAGAIGASVEDNLKVIINIGEQECLGANKHIHDDENCPIIENNISDILGGAFCLHGNSEDLSINVYCGNITDNIALRYPGSNTINQEGGKFSLYGGIIDPGIMVGGGIFEDNRIETETIKVRFWGNYEGAPTEPIVIECTLGITLNFPANTYVNGTHELSGWTNIPNSQTGWVPVGGQYAVNKDEDEYLDYYAVWDASVSYIVYIPDTCDIDNSGIGTMNISADINYFKKDSTVEITVNSDFVLKNIENVLDVLNYELTTNEPGIHGVLSDGDLVASFQYNNINDKILTLEVLDVGLSGDYEGVMTFTVVYSESGS